MVSPGTTSTLLIVMGEPSRYTCAGYGRVSRSFQDLVICGHCRGQCIDLRQRERYLHIRQTIKPLRHRISSYQRTLYISPQATHCHITLTFANLGASLDKDESADRALYSVAASAASTVNVIANAANASEILPTRL